MKKSLLLLIAFVLILVIFYLAFENTSIVNIKTAFGTIRSSIFMMVLFSFILGAFCMFLLHLISASQEEKIQIEQAEEVSSPYVRAARILYAHAHYEAALKELARIKNIASSLDALLLKIMCLMKLRRLEESCNDVEMARRYFPNAIDLLYVAADAYNKSNLFDKAKETLQSIIMLEPRNAYKAYIRLRDLFVNANNWIDAIKTHEDMVYHFPNFADEQAKNVYYGLCYKLACQFIDNKNFREALHYATKEMQDSDEQFSLSYYVQAKVYFYLKDEHNFTRTISKGISRTRSYALMKLMEDFYLAEFNPRGALEFYKNLIYETRKDKTVQLALGLYYQRLEMIEDAINIFQQLHEQFPKWYELSLLKGQLFLRLQEKDKALENFEEYFTHSNLPTLFICNKCGTKSFSYTEKCGVCDWWDSINLILPSDEESVESILWAESII